jgi:hypothetical protein
MKKWLSSLTIIGSLLLLGACNGDEEAAETEDTGAAQEEAPEASEESGAAAEGEENAESASAEQPEQPEPDLEGVPDVVAEVNGTEIEKPEFEEAYTMQFQQAAMMSQMSGEEVNQDDLKTQVADGLVSQELLIQEADNRELEVTEEDTNGVLDELVEQNGMESQDDLFAAFEEQDMPKDEVMSQVEMQVKVDKLIAEESGEINPSDEELQELYDQQVEQMEQMETEEETPSFEEMKPQLEEQVVMQKEGEAAQALVEELKADADVTMHL